MTTTIPDDLSERFALAKAIAREAGLHALGYFRNRSLLTVDTKINAQDVVSIADKEVEQLLRRRIAEAFPEDGMVGEEYGSDAGSSEFTWVMDPIDGTSPFIFGIPAWCVSVAVVKGERAVAGVIYAPCADELFAAAKGAGATMNGEPLKLGTTITLKNGVVGIGANHRIPARQVSGIIERLLDEGGMFIRNGSGALMLAYVAAGRLVAYYEPHMNAWDCMAGLLLVEEAGGWSEDFSGAARLRGGGVVIASALGARDDLLRLIEATAAAPLLAAS